MRGSDLGDEAGIAGDVILKSIQFKVQVEGENDHESTNDLLAGMQKTSTNGK